MLSVEEALQLVAIHCSPLAPRRVALEDALGLKLAADIASDIDSPPYDKSMLDGYAVRTADREPERHIVEEIAAGAAPRVAVTVRAAARIMTGAPIPEGADAVIPVEQTELIDAGTVRLHQTELAPGQNVLHRGVAMRAGDIVLQKGAVIRPIEIAILAETGHNYVSVAPRPRLAILPTGNELIDIEAMPAAGQIRNSNGPMLRAAGFRAEADTIALEVARDVREELTRQIQEGLKADVLVLSGGVSAGKFDLVPQVLTELGVEQVFHKIALRPGKPLWFGVKKFPINSEPESRLPASSFRQPASIPRTVLVFGLPGNPVSSLVCFELFVRPALAALAGRGFAQLSSIRAKLNHYYDHAGGRAACLPARLRLEGAETAVDILPWQGSADLATLARANGLICLPTEKRRFEPSEMLNVLLI